MNHVIIDQPQQIEFLKQPEESLHHDGPNTLQILF